ncbi:hypothetical protein ACKWTF_016650 [Chironomus riparius]
MLIIFLIMSIILNVSLSDKVENIFDSVKKITSGKFGYYMTQDISIPSNLKSKIMNKNNENTGRKTPIRTVRQIVTRNETSSSPNIFKQTILAMIELYDSFLFRNNGKRIPNVMINSTNLKNKSEIKS